MKTLSVALLTGLLSIGAHAGQFTGWTVNGSAKLLDSDNTLNLTANVGGQAGSGWAPTKLSLLSDFSVAFSFRLANDGSEPADGITIAFQNNAAGTAALGASGGYLGYQGIDKSVAFIYDTYENNFDTDRVAGFNTSVAGNGNVVDFWGGTTIGSAFPTLRDGVVYSWVDYSRANGRFLMYISNTNVKPLTASENISAGDWTAFFGSNDASVGFTGGTGASYDTQDILSFNVTTNAVPEPETYALMLGGLGVVAFMARRRRRA